MMAMLRGFIGSGVSQFSNDPSGSMGSMIRIISLVPMVISIQIIPMAPNVQIFTNGYICSIGSNGFSSTNGFNGSNGPLVSVALMAPFALEKQKLICFLFEKQKLICFRGF